MYCARMHMLDIVMRLTVGIVFAVLASAHATSAPLRPHWQFIQDEPNWVSARPFRQGLVLEGERATVQMPSNPSATAAGYRIWRWTLDPGADLPAITSVSAPLQNASGQLFTTPTGFLLSNLQIFDQGPQGTCRILSYDADLQQRWSWSGTYTSRCAHSVGTPDGGAVVFAGAGFAGIGATGLVRWQLSHTDLGANVDLPRLILIPSRSDHVVLASSKPDTRLWVLNAITGNIVAQQAISLPFDFMMAHRADASGIEFVTQGRSIPGNVEAELGVVRVDLTSMTVQQTLLMTGEIHAAKAHDRGFALIGPTQISVFDGAQLRWTRSLQGNTQGFPQFAVNAEGAAAVARELEIFRFNAAGEPMDAVPWRYTDSCCTMIELSPAGTLWLLQQGIPPADSTLVHRLYRIPAEAQLPDLNLLLRLPAAALQVSALHMDPDGHAQVLMWRAATSLTGTTGEWQHYELDPQGQVRNHARRSDPPPSQVERVGRHWAVLSGGSPAGLQLSVWNPEHGTVWQHPVEGNARLHCTTDQCGLLETFLSNQQARFTRFDAQGILQVIPEPIQPVHCYGQKELRGLREHANGDRDLLAFTSGLPQVVLSLTQVSPATVVTCHQDQLLVLTPDQRLSLFGANGPVWPAPLQPINWLTFGSTQQFAQANGADPAQQNDLLQFSLADGTVQRRYQLPIPAYVEDAESHDGRLIWLRSQQHVLHAVHADGRALATDAQYPVQIRTLDADRAVVASHGKVAAYIAPLFRDGLETDQ